MDSGDSLPALMKNMPPLMKDLAEPISGVTADGVAPTLGAVVATAKAVADPLRANVLRVLQDESYGVLELCGILDIAQPALSHHLKLLRQAGLVTRRREGNTLFYRRAPVASDVQHALLAAIDQAPLPPDQRRRVDTVHRERSARSEAFFADHADDFARHQARICEPGVYAGSVLEVVDRRGLGDGTALEIGPGDGELLASLATRFRSAAGIDNARRMLDRCAAAVSGLDNVRLVHGDFARLPQKPRHQLVVAAMVVHHQPSPQVFFRHAARLLRRDGVLIVAELTRHDHEWARSACGDLWLGFEPTELAEWAGNAGLATSESQFLAQRNGFRIQIHTYHHSST